MPKVSIIIPVYNKEKYIKKTIESVLSQNFDDFEVIIVNDGSTDKSKDIVELYQSKRNNIKLYNISNSGVSNARNVGLQHATGTWIQFLDADDLIDKNYLKETIKIGEQEDPDIIFSNFKMIDEFGKVVKNIQSNTQGLINQKELLKKFMELQYDNGFFGYISNKLIKKSVIDILNLKFKEGLSLAEDLLFYLQAYPHINKAMFIDITSFYYLQTSENYLNKDNIDYREQLKIHLQIKKWYLENDLYEEYQEILDKKISEYVFFIIFHDNERGKSIKKAFYEIIRNKEVYESIHPEYVQGFSAKVLQDICKKKCGLLQMKFWLRNVVRKIYRGFK